MFLRLCEVPGVAPLPSSVPHVLAVRCNWCSKQRPEFRVHRLQSNQVICDYCLEWHGHALEVMGGAVPVGCQECQRPTHELTADPLVLAVRLYVVPRDGIYQLLCGPCKDTHAPKHADLYRGTEYGRQDLKL